jgi:hypothetical protein
VLVLARRWRPRAGLLFTTALYAAGGLVWLTVSAAVLGWSPLVALAQLAWPPTHLWRLLLWPIWVADRLRLLGFNLD